MDYPSKRAMAAAVDMEVHAACGTTTQEKGKALDAAFPAYDDLFAAAKAVIYLFAYRGEDAADYADAVEKQVKAALLLAGEEGK